MLYHVFLFLVEKCGVFNVFKYITFRGFCAIFTAFFFGLYIGSHLIKKFAQIQVSGQPIRSDGPESHLKTKNNIPTMGGLLTVGSVCFSVLLWADLRNIYTWIVITSMLSFATIGFFDDYYKLKLKNSRGISAGTKLFWQLLLASMISIWVVYVNGDSTAFTLSIPFLKNTAIDLGYFYIPFAVTVIVGASNAVNLTDGLDGLAIGTTLIVMTCFTVITYVVGHSIFANYLQFHYIPGVGELAVLSTALIGAGLAFLWYNAYPAKIFMGDVGSLSLGAVIGVLSVITKHELVLVMIGGLFVIEAISVILQVGSYKLRKKRIFLMAPIHHHFEKLGWSESTIVIRFWIIAVLFALLGLSTLKLR